MQGHEPFEFVVIGAGPAGLAAGHELAKNGRKVLVLEQEDVPGGISRTVKYKDYYFDLGGHRFFTRYPQVRQLWQETLAPDSFPTVKRPAAKGFGIPASESLTMAKIKLFSIADSPHEQEQGLQFVRSLL